MLNMTNEPAGFSLCVTIICLHPGPLLMNVKFAFPSSSALRYLALAFSLSVRRNLFVLCLLLLFVPNGAEMATKTTTATTRRTATAGGSSKRSKRVKQVGLTVGIIVTFLAGFHFGAKNYLKSQGYGSDDYDPIDDFVNKRLLPAMNETYESLVAQYSSGTSNETTDAPTPILRPGQRFKAAASGKVRPKHPVVLVPGFITGGLEIWSAEHCLNKLFRQAIWGGNSMAKAFLSDKECWLRHVALDPLTGMDPAEDIRIRAQAGFEAADYFISSFWIFGKLIQNLADVGYVPKNMQMMTYDWRMAFPLLEERDGFLTDLKLEIERMVEVNGGEKVVMLGHSMGNCVILFFLRWVCEPKENGGGGGGEDWVDRHVESFVNVGGPLLGVPKAVSALVSGEMEETALLGKLGLLLENYLGVKKRKDLIQTWASVWNMIPSGGHALWEIGADVAEGDNKPMRLLEPSPTQLKMISDLGKVDSCPNSEDGSDSSCANPDAKSTTKPYKVDRSFVSEEVAAIIEDFDSKDENGTLDDMIQFMLDWGGGVGPKVAAGRYHSFRSGGSNNDEPSLAQWHNPAATPLPKAPDMKIYCLYGVGVKTERGYIYKRNLDSTMTKLLDPPFVIDFEYHDATRNIANGVRTADGDGSVPLLSLGYMCADGWVNNKKLNPADMAIITKEYKHEGAFSISDPMRAGPKAGEHCDILGNEEMTFDVLKIATGTDPVESRIISDIKEIAEKINSHELGGLNYVSTAESRFKPGPVPED